MRTIIIWALAIVAAGASVMTLAYTSSLYWQEEARQKTQWMKICVDAGGHWTSSPWRSHDYCDWPQR